VDVTGLGSFSVAGFCISGVQPWGFTARELVNY
jgi:hypothetical protein